MGLRMLLEGCLAPRAQGAPFKFEEAEDDARADEAALAGVLHAVDRMMQGRYGARARLRTDKDGTRRADYVLGARAGGSGHVSVTCSHDGALLVRVWGDSGLVRRVEDAVDSEAAAARAAKATILSRNFASFMWLAPPGADGDEREADHLGAWAFI